MKNQIKMKKWLWVLLVSLSVMEASAQNGSIAEVKPVFEKMKAIKSYSYESLTTAVFPNGQKDQQHTKVYMDRLNKKLSYKTEQQLVMLNQYWLFRADHENKTASVFDVSKYDKKNKDVLPQIESVFQYDMASVFMDSVLSRYGKLLSTTKKNSLVTYKIGFKEEGAALKEMTIVYNSVTQLPESIYFRIENEIQSGRKVRMDILCNNYSVIVPQSVFDEKQYFNIVKGKPVLVQFKNYKLYSVL
jgi:outer membrane lipoprotein-sorting protein